LSLADVAKPYFSVCGRSPTYDRQTDEQINRQTHATTYAALAQCRAVKNASRRISV